MAKDSTRALTGMRTLSKQYMSGIMDWEANVGPGAISKFVPAPIATGTGFSETQWQGVDNKAMLFTESYFDLSGYELDDLTVGIVDARVQDPGVYTYSGLEDVFFCYDIYSQERLTVDDLKLIKTNHTLTSMSAPGMAEGPLDRSQIVFGMMRLFAKNANITGLPTMMLNTRTVRFGSGNATAVQKLWTYRIVVFIQTPAGGDRIVIPATTHLMIADVQKEDELPYMMRLSRSYELSTGN